MGKKKELRRDEGIGLGLSIGHCSHHKSKSKSKSPVSIFHLYWLYHYYYLCTGKDRSREDTIIDLHLRKKGRRNTRKAKVVSSSSKRLYVQKCFEICCYVSLRI
ncbi:hypothetical protein CMV_005881 [Castanea mollissima]|uniref:Uncharacterized protein n=1 Tax=Castanea mollissima TaxID=60419 RepID=A0A8J4VRR3_9ROSI|nr:hypothetical protein CMV_005881 [Castanea mollissima]